MINPFKSILLVSFIFVLLNLEGQNRITLNGYVRDASSGEELIGANVFVMNGEAGTTSNEYGYYALTIDPGYFTLAISYMGYRTMTLPIQLHLDTVLNGLYLTGIYIS